MKKILDCLKQLFKEESYSRIICEPEKEKIKVPGDKIPSNPKDYLNHKLYYPWASSSGENGMSTQGQYKHGYPLGAVIHYHAGRNNTNNFLEFMRLKRYCTFIIDRSGNIIQDFPINRWGFHAGKSSWPGISKVTVHKALVGIEIMSAGKLTLTKQGYQTWWGDLIPKNDVRTISEKHGDSRPGHYHKFTLDQEKSLIQLLFWLEENGKGKFLYNYVLGHNEVSPGRKSDPGGSLSMSMWDLRYFMFEIITANDTRYIKKKLKEFHY